MFEICAILIKKRTKPIDIVRIYVYNIYKQIEKGEV